MELIQTTPATEKPVTLAQFKDHVVAESTDDDSLLEVYLSGATRMVEKITRRALCSQEFLYTLQCWPLDGVIKVPRPPLQTVDSVKYLDVDGVEQTLAEGVDYQVSGGEITAGEGGAQGLIAPMPGTTWPALQAGMLAPIAIAFTCGYGDTTKFTDQSLEDLVNAIQLLGAHLYRNREATTLEQLKTLPDGVDVLLDDYMVIEGV